MKNCLLAFLLLLMSKPLLAQTIPPAAKPLEAEQTERNGKTVRNNRFIGIPVVS